MYVKIQQKHDSGDMADYGYRLMGESFFDLVFGSNLEGYASGGDYCVVRVGGNGIGEIKNAILDVWEREDYKYQPDELLSLKYVSSIQG